MEVVNLKSAITFRVELTPEQIVAWSTKSFRGKRDGRGTNPEPKEHVVFDVYEITIESRDMPWYRFTKPQRITVLWSNVLSVQLEEAQVEPAPRCPKCGASFLLYYPVEEFDDVHHRSRDGERSMIRCAEIINKGETS